MTSSKGAEKQFRLAFMFAILFFCFVIIVFGILMIKVLLLFFPEINIMGLNFTNTL